MKGWGRDAGESLTLSFELVLPALLAALLGYYLDSRFQSSPVCLAIGLFLGAAAGFWNVVRKIPPEENKKKDKVKNGTRC
ncbi:AtpZ/AtpI family protein [Candidatus Saganbacteria bacterium]|nr:AtpZ/AtpI family protein [Candidatus Saganbacteria bacterium]